MFIQKATKRWFHNVHGFSSFLNLSFGSVYWIYNVYSIYYSRIDFTVKLQTINTKVPVFLSTFETNSYPKWLWKHLTTRKILTIPQAVVLHIHQITDLAFDEFPSSSIFAFIKATLLSIPFFIEIRTTNPIVMKPIVTQSSRSTFTLPLYHWISPQFIIVIKFYKDNNKPCVISSAF